MNDNRTMSAREAAAALAVSPATLYAYVSRGLIRSEEVPGNSRERRYSREDVQRLLDRKAQRRDPAHATRETLHWGAPLLDSALTLIADGRLYYRGQDASALARACTLEQVAALLWTGSPAAAHELFAGNAGILPALFASGEASYASPITAMQLALALAAERDLAAFDLAPRNVAQTGARILRLLVSIVAHAGQKTSDHPVHPVHPVKEDQVASEPRIHGTLATTLAQAWHVSGYQGMRLLDAAMILCADHELNASSFAARVIASAGANPYGVVGGGMAALQGVRHGGHTRRVSAFLREIEGAGQTEPILRERLQRGDDLPGFGHPLYPQGDPRATLLLELLSEYAADPAALAFAAQVCGVVRQATGKHPTIDFALVIFERALRLPPDSALVLFTLGRAVGWIAHAIEQYATGELIRPRARYTGVLPLAP